MFQKMYSLRKPLLIWVCANVIGFGVLGALYFLLPAKIMMLGNITPTLIISLPIGLAQWIALRRILQISILWSLTILIGAPIAYLTLRIVPDVIWQVLGDDESVAVLTAGYLVIGFAIGLPQWIILRRYLARASIWILGSSFGAWAGLWFILVTDLIHQAGAIAYIVGILIYSIVTGLTLTGLLAHNNKSQTNLVNAT